MFFGAVFPFLCLIQRGYFDPKRRQKAQESVAQRVQSKRKRWRSLPPMSRKRLSRSAHPTPAGRQRLAKPSAAVIARTDRAICCQRATVNCAHNHISSQGVRCVSGWTLPPIEFGPQTSRRGDLTAAKAPPVIETLEISICCHRGSALPLPHERHDRSGLGHGGRTHVDKRSRLHRPLSHFLQRSSLQRFCRQGEASIDIHSDLRRYRIGSNRI